MHGSHVWVTDPDQLTFAWILLNAYCILILGSAIFFRPVRYMKVILLVLGLTTVLVISQPFVENHVDPLFCVVNSVAMSALMLIGSLRGDVAIKKKVRKKVRAKHSRSTDMPPQA